MNLIHTSERNALDATTVGSLLFVKVNGPPSYQFNAELYASAWIKAGHHAATDAPIGRPKLKIEKDNRCDLFC